MNILFFGIVVFLIILAVFDLVVGVSNDAVNFLNSAIGAKVARHKTIVIVAAIGVFAGAAMSNGMMDVARHGIMTPQYFSFYDVMCVFLAVMVTDVVLLDIFNTLGMPTSTTVSMVFELLGGAFAIALLQIAKGATAIDGTLLSLGDLLNTEKAISVIFGIFLSVAIAFVLGTLVQWVARLVFTFTYRVNGVTTDHTGNMGNRLGSSLKIGIFGGIAVTSIVWFLLINGLKGSNIMTPVVKSYIDENTWLILGGGFAIFSIILTILSAFKLPILKFVVLLGTFALAMAFAGNDLVNFVGVPLTGLDAYNDYVANGSAAWKLPTMAELPAIRPHYVTPEMKGNYTPYFRDEESKVRYWAIPGQEGYTHIIGGLEKDGKTGAISTDSENHDLMCRLRAEKVAKIPVPDLQVMGDEDADLLIVGFGSTYGHLVSAMLELQQKGYKVAQAQFKYINPLPKNTAEVLKRYKKVVVAEQNLGQLAIYLRGQIDGFTPYQYNEVKGQPFVVSELVTAFEDILKK